MAKCKLTKTAVDRIPLQPHGQSLYWDIELPGFGLVVGKTAKTYVAQRDIAGRARRITIGKHGVFTTEEARKEARRLLNEMARGIDPATEKWRARALSATLGEVFEEYLVARPALRAVTVYDYRNTMKRVFEDWSSRPLSSITKDMVARRHRELGEKHPPYANGAMRVLRAVFNFARARYEDADGHSLLGDNPVHRLSQTRAWFKERRRQSCIKPHQLRDWFSAVRALRELNKLKLLERQKRLKRPGQDEWSIGITVCDYLEFLVLTGLRRSEAAHLRWEDVDLVASVISIGDTKNGEPHMLPLSDYLHTLLEQRKASAKSRYVFPGSGDSKRPFVEPGRHVESVIAASSVQFTLHDLRRTFITIGESLDIPAYALKRLVNHKMSGDVTAGYIVADVERLRRPMQQITDFVLRAAGIKAQAAVIPFDPTLAAGERPPTPSLLTA